MNENIDLTKILKDCPKGTKFYSPLCGEVDFKEIRSDEQYSIVSKKDMCEFLFTEKGFYYDDEDGECLLFPSKDQRDWRKFTAPWYKKEKFDPKTLQPFDKVLVRDRFTFEWRCAFYSHIMGIEGSTAVRCATTANSYTDCIPFNDETKHLVGTVYEAPEFYRYWEE